METLSSTASSILGWKKQPDLSFVKDCNQMTFTQTAIDPPVNNSVKADTTL